MIKQPYKIQLSKITHYNKKRIKISFPWNKELIDKVKKIEDRKWSQSKNCWHVPYNKETFAQLLQVFAQENLIYPTKKQLPSAKSFQYKVKYSEYIQNGESNKKVVGHYIVANPIDQNWFELYCPVHKKGWTETIRNIEGRQWDTKKICWRVPYVKQTFYQIKSYIGLKFLRFNFKIEKNIPSHYEVENLPTTKQKKGKILKIDILNKEQKLALHKLTQALTLKRLSHSTLKAYKQHLIAIFIYYPKIHPENLTVKDIQDYILHQIKFKKIAVSTQNIIINAVKSYWEKALNKPKTQIEIPRPKKPKHLPNVFSQEEVVTLIESPDNIKHRLVLLLIYSAGLRLGEVINIKTRDINLDRRVIFIKNGKGNKDRFVTLAEEVVPFLKKYKNQYRPSYWLFEGKHGGQYGKSTVQKIFKMALEKSKVFSYGTVHTLRHSYATHCVENGFSIGLLQEALGHQSIKTTEKYLHISSKALKKLRSPLDIIKGIPPKQS